MVRRRDRARQGADQEVLRRTGMGRQAFGWGAALLRGTGIQDAGPGAAPLLGMGIRDADLGAGRPRGKEIPVADSEEPLEAGKGKRAFVLGAVLLPDMARRAWGGYWERNRGIPLRLQQFDIGYGIGLAYHVHVLRPILALRSVRVCDVLSRDGQHPFLRVCDACPPHVAYREVNTTTAGDKKMADHSRSRSRSDVPRCQDCWKS